ncbi:hypothetical protein CDV36_011516 [Fusarium kuroshium]|uniref:Cytochrome P450 monooxygenase ATR2 n=1 Tax=Fusarium kuroshium TaxID=2010991 RepID=A0A3M2RU87_9HYPO|nr:hypothetical protein CDV36_011516 [Fusarium kuroshium]
MGNVQSFIDIAVDRWPIILAAVVVFLTTVFGPIINRTILLSGLPVVGDGDAEKRRMAYLAGARKLYSDGYQKFKDGVFMITTSRSSPIVVISPKFLPELHKLPDSVVSMDAAVDETMETKYTKIETSVPIIPHTIKGDLTPSLNRLNPTIAQEVREVLQLSIPSCDDWTEVNIHHSLLRIVGMVSGRVFIGPELCRSEKYLDAAINYTMEVMGAQRAVQQIRPWLRPFLASRLPAVKRLDQRIAEAEDFLNPIVKQRAETIDDPSVEKPDDMLQWLMDRKDKFPDKNSQNLAKVQLGLSFAAIHTTTLTATNAFYDLAAMPEVQKELRVEIREALSQTSGVFTSQALQNMKKMDSFLKEVLRLHPATMASFQRKVLKPFTLSNGQKIPEGVTIEIPAVAISADSSVFPRADKFDPLRFYRLRQQAKDDGSAEKAALHQFVSVNQSSLTFGFGRHACPGRFFAANEIKMILANAILQYDIKLIDATERYPNIEFAHMSIPDPSRKLLFKALEI